MKLYGFPLSPNTWKVRAVANHLKMPLVLEIIDLSKPRTPAYLALNPTGRTPTLVDGDFKLWESNAIIQYIAGKSANSLWPNDARIRADISKWHCWQLAHWGCNACGPLTFECMVKKILNLGPPDEAIVARAMEAFNREARTLEQHLARQSYLVGNDLTLADFAIAAPLVFAKEADMPLAAYPRLSEWFGRITALPAWREAAPPMRAAA
jgi:glutathione S-transferase